LQNTGDSAGGLCHVTIGEGHLLESTSRTVARRLQSGAVLNRVGGWAAHP